ncbi:MAG TPA: alternative ribosome rescue aminoacyl-tRNA hydrolase ArfB [Candidatus Babeliales bacterium]|nr:alternative ribosome rescue aminoacyl-tRNA hydrolase ArfB [Candidatus Babeliales bacterium]
MKDDLSVKDGIIIPAHELDIASSKSGGPGGQHVNKTESRITVRWNIRTTTALTYEQKQVVLQKLQSQVTTEGEIVIHNSSSRSQQHNKQAALLELAHRIRKALHVPKKRHKTKIPQSIVESRLRAKKVRSSVKKTRKKDIDFD